MRSVEHDDRVPAASGSQTMPGFGSGGAATRHLRAADRRAYAPRQLLEAAYFAPQDALHHRAEARAGGARITWSWKRANRRDSRGRTALSSLPRQQSLVAREGEHPGGIVISASGEPRRSLPRSVRAALAASAQRPSRSELRGGGRRRGIGNRRGARSFARSPRKSLRRRTAQRRKVSRKSEHV